MRNFRLIEVMGLDAVKCARSMSELDWKRLRMIIYTICELFREIVECVQYLHSRDPPIIHRDLKPANILITAKPTNERYVKLCDFGIAVDHKTKTMYSTRGKSQTHTANVGTPVYMAPEVMRGRDYNRSADIYSLGMIALDMFKITVNE